MNIVKKVKYNESAADLKSYDEDRIMTVVHEGEKVSTLRYKAGGGVSHVNVSSNKFSVVAQHRAVVGEGCISVSGGSEVTIEDVDVCDSNPLIKVAGVWCRASGYRFVDDGMVVSDVIYSCCADKPEA